MAEPVPFGPFLGVQVDNAVTLAFADDDRARAAEATGPSDHDLDPRGQASSERG